MRLEVHAFALARTADEPSEDAWAVDVTRGRLAVADGASSAWRAGDWAATLVDRWVERPVPRPRGGDDTEGALRWIDTVRTRFVTPASGVEEAWFTEAAAARGSHAALLGVSLTGMGGRRPRLLAVSVGDVCLLVVRDGRLQVAFPIDDPDLFGTRPSLISSLPDGAPTAEEVMIHQRPLQAGDVVLVASDAMAAFLLRLGREQPGLWDVVARIDRAGFARLVEEGLAVGLLERDDVTLVRGVLVAGGDDA